MFGKTKINETEVGVGPFLKTMLTSTLPHCNGYYYQASPIFGHNSFQEDPYCFFLKKMGRFRPFFFIFVFSIQLIIHYLVKLWRWLDLNRGPQVSKTTALPTGTTTTAQGPYCSYTAIDLLTASLLHFSCHFFRHCESNPCPILLSHYDRNLRL